MNNPPSEIFEWMGKEFANRLSMLETECRSVVSEWRAEIAEAKSDRVLIIASINEKLNTIKDGIDGKDGRDGIDGKDGINGEKGEKGEQGEKGEAGEKGEKGDPGIISAEAFADAYQSVWTEGTEYIRGQVVTWGGSLWLCLNTGTDKPGDGSEAWRLIVKRGRDGKDGKNGDPGPEGKQGPKGDKGSRGYDA